MGKERFMLVGSETMGPQCGPNSGAFMTWDTKNWQKTRTFKLTDTYRVKNGLYTDGNSPANLFCTHWFETHPKYRNGGLVAMAWYEHGTRFLNVDHGTGKITEKGWFYPVGGSTSAAYWVTNDILYTIDYQRGIDILRFTDKPSSGTVRVAASPGYQAPAPPAAVPPALRARLEADPYSCPLPGL